MHAQQLNSMQSKLSESLELQGYYQKMAEDYRAKYLSLEQKHQMLKHTHDYDIERLDQDHSKQVSQLNERLDFEAEENKRRVEQAI